jgi:hypothetical protein
VAKDRKVEKLMAKDDIDIKVRLIDIEGIHGLIEALSDVAEASVLVVEGWEAAVSDDRFMRRLDILRAKIIDLNDYVDEHMHDE